MYTKPFILFGARKYSFYIHGIHWLLHWYTLIKTDVLRVWSLYCQGLTKTFKIKINVNILVGLFVRYRENLTPSYS